EQEPFLLMPIELAGQVRTDAGAFLIGQERIFADDARKTLLHETKQDDQRPRQAAGAHDVADEDPPTLELLGLVGRCFDRFPTVISKRLERHTRLKLLQLGQHVDTIDDSFALTTQSTERGDERGAILTPYRFAGQPTEKRHQFPD